MGAELSCDMCRKIFDEKRDEVYERKGVEVTHLCVDCFDEQMHKGYTRRSVYDAIGAEERERAAGVK